MPTEPSPVLRLRNVSFERGGRAILRDVDLTVSPGQRWALLGPNGSGKTSLIRIAALYEFPTSGAVEVLGHVAGHVDVRKLRPAVGFNSPALVDLLRPEVKAVELVTAARYGSLVPWWADATPADRVDALAQLERVGCGPLAERTFGTLSSGERQRVMLARTLITDPKLLLLDEPGATLDLGGREQLIATLDALAASEASPPMVFVTHHVEEIPSSFTHGALLRDGAVCFAGRLEDALEPARLSECFGLALDVQRRNGRWWAQGA